MLQAFLVVLLAGVHLWPFTLTAAAAAATVPGYVRIIAQDFQFGDFFFPVVLVTNPDTEQACADECTARPDCTLYTYHPLSAQPDWTQPGRNCILKTAPVSEWSRPPTWCSADSGLHPCICSANDTTRCPGASNTVTGIKVSEACGTGQVWDGTTCEDCAAGKVPSPLGPWCIYCPAGTVKQQPINSSVDAACVPATLFCGSSSYANGLGVCIKCPEGQVSNPTGAGCQFCLAGTAKHPKGSSTNATCLSVALACPPGSFSNGTGVCLFCDPSLVPDGSYTKCLPCNDAQALNGGPSRIKFPQSTNGSCVQDLCHDNVQCMNGGECTMTSLSTVNCTCTAAWSGNDCTVSVADKVYELQARTLGVDGPFLSPVGFDMPWWLKENDANNCSNACAAADQWWARGGAIVPFTVTVGQHACAPWNKRNANIGHFVGVVSPSRGCRYRLRNQQVATNDYWCLCITKRNTPITKWAPSGKSCQLSFGNNWGRVAMMGSNSSTMLCRGASRASLPAVRSVLGYASASSTKPVCWTVNGSTTEFDYLCYRPDPSVCYDRPEFNSPSYKEFWDEKCVWARDNGSSCATNCEEGFLPVDGRLPTTYCLNAHWQIPQPPACRRATCSSPPPSMLPVDAASWVNCNHTRQGTKCYSKCKRGFVGAPFTTCLGGDGSSSEEWSNVTGSCVLYHTESFRFSPQNYRDRCVMDLGNGQQARAQEPGPRPPRYEQVPLSRCPGLPDDTPAATTPFAIRIIGNGTANKYLCREAAYNPNSGLIGFRLYWQDHLPGDGRRCCWHRVSLARLTGVCTDGFSSISSGVDGTDDWVICHYYWNMFAAKVGSTEDLLDFCWFNPSAQP